MLSGHKQSSGDVHVARNNVCQASTNLPTMKSDPLVPVKPPVTTALAVILTITS